jgi:hypothetical protein
LTHDRKLLRAALKALRVDADYLRELRVDADYLRELMDRNEGTIEELADARDELRETMALVQDLIGPEG